MAPGLISEGGRLVPGLPEFAPVAVAAEGKKHAMAIGVLLMSSDQIASEKKGEAISVIQFMNDGIWLLKPIQV